ncbi:MAG: YihA family ribosome biogenesis GTP-binding protein [Desulfuromonadales bacterium]|nr:YihA family ribosome biogenesis GTP-binding protein [Desulfuromonadales bacterium]
MLVKSVDFITSAPSLASCPVSEWPEIAFAGRSNVGKSSLINCLLNRKGLVRTSSTPGRTQLLNYFAINESLYFVDLPGYGFARAPRSVREKWQPMVHGYLKGRQSLRAVVWLLDVRRDPSPEDLEFLDWLEENEIPTIPVVTKIDKVSKNQLARSLAKISSATGLSKDLLTPFSVQTRQGYKEVWELISMALEPEA